MDQPDIELDGDKKKEAIAVLKRTLFNNLIIDKHYFNKFGHPRHGVTLEKAKEIYSQYDKIISVSYRSSKVGRKYCFYYRLNKNHSYKLLFFLDRNPPCLFNAMHSGKNIENKLLRKYWFMR